MSENYCHKCHDIQLSPLTRRLWAKSEPAVKSLWHHALDTGFCAAVLAEDARFRASIQSIAQWLELTSPQSKRLEGYLAACHDCYGKAASGFQLKVPELAQPFKDAGMISALDRDAVGDFRHERYGAKRYLAEAGTFSIPRIPARIFASAQRAILERADPAAGLTIIEAPMGEGKTEAGAFQAARLCTAWNKQGSIEYRSACAAGVG